VDLEGTVTYHSFPRLIQYSEMDPLKTLSFKIYKGLRNLLYQICDVPRFENLDQSMAELQQYNSLFNENNPDMDPYEMVIVLQDNSRWKIDPNKT
jgi:hypothetical protein